MDAGSRNCQRSLGLLLSEEVSPISWKEGGAGPHASEIVSGCLVALQNFSKDHVRSPRCHLISFEQRRAANAPKRSARVARPTRLVAQGGVKQHYQASFLERRFEPPTDGMVRP